MKKTDGADEFGSVLSGEMIKLAREQGFVVIDPFSEKRVKTSSYDVSLGENFWTTAPEHPGIRLFNPYSQQDIRELWQGPWQAMTVREHLKSGPFKDQISKKDFKGLSLDNKIIILRPGETILAHTQEFIGGRDKVTTMLKARSSFGRIFLSVCKDAGWGDVGYFNRWTMEVQNSLAHYWTVLIVGQPIAQMVFFSVNPIKMKQYSSSGTYQKTAEINKLKKSWKPENMLPRLRRI